MIAIYTELKEAEKLCEEIHNFLIANCPGYNATKWQIPQPDKDKKQWFVSLPVEYEKTPYPKAKDLKPFIKPETDKAKEIDEKPPPDFLTVEVISKA